MTVHPQSWRGAAVSFGLLLLFAQGAGAAPIAFTKYNDPALFIDISGTGTPLGLTDDGETNISTMVGNAIFGAGTVRVSNNGVIGLTDSGDVGFANTALPSASVFGGTARALLPFWDDLDSELGNVYWQESGGVLIVQWDRRPHFPGSPSSGTATIQVQLFSAGPVLARFAYPDVEFEISAFDFGASATIGYQTGATEAYQFSFDSPVLRNGDVIDITAVPEPSGLALLGLALAGLAATRRRRQ